ncbi:MATE family efflux transporter [Tistrella mobilis]
MRAFTISAPEIMTGIAPPAAGAQTPFVREAPFVREVRATFTLAWPIVLTNLAQMAITTTDVLVIGRLGPEALAAATLGANLYFALFIYGMGLAMATAPMLAQAVGARLGMVRDLRRTVRQGLWLCLAVSTAWILVLGQTETILRAMGQAPDLAAAAAVYVDTLRWGILPALWFVVLRNFISALGRPRPAMVITIAAVAVNAVLDLGLVLGHFGLPALGLEGAGIASTLANIFLFGALALVTLADRRFNRFALYGRWWRADWPRLGEMLKIGLPISLTMGFEVTVFNAAAFLMGLIGTNQLAAHAIALQLAAVTFMVPMGVAQAGTVRVGIAAGRGDAGRIREAGRAAILLGIGFMALSAVMMLTMPRTLIGFFLDGNDPAVAETTAIAVGFLGIAAIFQLADGAQAVGAGLLRGLKDTAIPMIYAGFGYWGVGLGVGSGLAFGLDMGGTGLWIGLASGLATVAVLMLTRWTRRHRLGLVPAGAAGMRTPPAPRALPEVA